jgi:hypothetical protein
MDSIEGDKGKTAEGRLEDTAKETHSALLPPLLRGISLLRGPGKRPKSLKCTRGGERHICLPFRVPRRDPCGASFCVLFGWFRSFKLLWCSVLLCGYVFMTGFSASACRAMCMIQLALLGQQSRDAGHPANAVCVAEECSWQHSVAFLGFSCDCRRVCSGHKFLFGKRAGRHLLLASPVIWLATRGRQAGLRDCTPGGPFLNFLGFRLFFSMPVSSMRHFPSILEFLLEEFLR